jgi:hypothetical protein
MTACDRCGDDIHPVWAAHTAADGEDVCSDCCDVCEEETMTTTTTIAPGIIGSNVQFAAAGIEATAHIDNGGCVHLRITPGTVVHGVTVSGSVDELRSVAWAMARAVDAIEGAE